MEKEKILVPSISLQRAVAEWEKENDQKMSDQEEVELLFMAIESIEQQVINSFYNARRISLSSNMINKAIPDIHLSRLETLSLGRNRLTSIRGLDHVAGTLKNLWLSYNEIQRLENMSLLVNLETFYIGNNLIGLKDGGKYDELIKISNLPNLRDVVFKGNPFTLQDPTKLDVPKEKDRYEYFVEVKKRLPTITLLDGMTVLDYVNDSGENNDNQDDDM